MSIMQWGPAIDENGAVVVLLDIVQAVKKAKSVICDELVDEACEFHAGARVRMYVVLRFRAISRVPGHRSKQPRRITPLIGFAPVV